MGPINTIALTPLSVGILCSSTHAVLFASIWLVSQNDEPFCSESWSQIIDWQVEIIGENDEWEHYYIDCSRAVREHTSILEQGEKMFASEPSTKSGSLLISRASRTRVVGDFARQRSSLENWNSCSGGRSRLGSHICLYYYHFIYLKLKSKNSIQINNDFDSNINSNFFIEFLIFKYIIN